MSHRTVIVVSLSPCPKLSSSVETLSESSLLLEEMSFCFFILGIWKVSMHRSHCLVHSRHSENDLLIFELGFLFSKIKADLSCSCWSLHSFIFPPVLCYCFPIALHSTIPFTWLFSPTEFTIPQNIPYSQPGLLKPLPAIPCKKYRQQAEAMTGRPRQIFLTLSIWRPRCLSYLVPLIFGVTTQAFYLPQLFILVKYIIM